MHYCCMDKKHLLALANTYASHVNRSAYRVAERAGLHNRLFVRLANGGGCRVDTFVSAMDWFSDNWPADLEWPRHIPRPARSKKDAA